MFKSVHDVQLQKWTGCWFHCFFCWQFESFDKDGNRSDFYNLSATVQGAPGMKQAYRFYTTIFDFSDDPNGYNQFENYLNP